MGLSAADCLQQHPLSLPTPDLTDQLSHYYRALDQRHKIVEDCYQGEPDEMRQGVLTAELGAEQNRAAHFSFYADLEDYEKDDFLDNIRGVYLVGLSRFQPHPLKTVPPIDFSKLVPIGGGVVGAVTGGLLARKLGGNQSGIIVGVIVGAALLGAISSYIQESL